MEHESSKPGIAQQAGPKPRPDARLLWVALAAVLLMGFKPYHAYDVWHHIRCGWHAWHHGPATFEPFSCTGKVLGLPWLQYEWLAQIFIFGSHEALGVNGTILLKAVLYAGALGMMGLACRERGARWEAVLVAVVLAALPMSQRSFVRPGMFSFVAFGYLLWALERSRRGKAVMVWCLPAVFALWANLHGAYVAGWAILGMAAAGILADGRLGRLAGPEPMARSLRRMAIVLAGCVAAVLINPYGVHILEVPLKLSRSPVVTKTINEWKPFSLSMWLSVHHLFVPAVLMACVVGWRRLRVADALTVAAFGYLAVTARRHVALAAFVTAPLVAQELSPLFAWLARKRWPAWRVRGALYLACAAGVLASHDFSLRTLRLGIDPSKYPRMAGDFLEISDIRGNLFNDYADGNYLMWRRYPDNLVFVDGRIDTYGAAVMKLWNVVKNANKAGERIQFFDEKFVTQGWEKILKRFDVKACVVRFKVDAPKAEPKPEGPDDAPPTDPLVDALWASPDWSLVFWDDIIMVFLRRDQVGDRYVFQTRPDTFNAARLASAKVWRAAVKDLSRRIAMHKRLDCATARVCMANALQTVNRFAQALPHLQQALALQPFEAGHAYNVAACLLRLNRHNEAAKLFLKARDLGSQEPEKTWNGLGYCRLERRDYRGALKCFRQAIKINPKYTFAYLSMSVAHERRGDRAAALAAVRQALQIDPQHQAAKERLKALEESDR